MKRQTVYLFHNITNIVSPHSYFLVPPHPHPHLDWILILFSLRRCLIYNSCTMSCCFVSPDEWVMYTGHWLSGQNGWVSGRWCAVWVEGWVTGRVACSLNFWMKWLWMRHLGTDLLPICCPSSPSRTDASCRPINGMALSPLEYCYHG